MLEHAGEQFRPGRGAFGAWAYTCTRYVVLRYLSRLRRRRPDDLARGVRPYEARRELTMRERRRLKRRRPVPSISVDENWNYAGHTRKKLWPSQ